MRVKRYLFYWLSVAVSYIFPLIYFIVRFTVGVKTTTVIPMPIIITLAILVIKISLDIPNWIKDWRPSFLKGFIKGLPVIFMTAIFVSLGLVLEGAITELRAFTNAYWEVIGVLFGGMSTGTIFTAFHLKYKEQHLLSQGYTLGVINI
jgi:hypothetical protein